MRVKGWTKFQHYQSGNRRPDWIKLHRNILDDVDWHELDGDTAKSLIMVWLIASESGGELPCTKKLAFRLRLSEQRCKALINKLSHWLEGGASDVLADGYQDARIEEEEKKKEKESASAHESPLSILKAILDDQRARAFVEHRQRLKIPLTVHAAGLLVKQLEKCPDPNAAADLAIERGWRAVKAEWVARESQGPPRKNGVVINGSFRKELAPDPPRPPMSEEEADRRRRQTEAAIKGSIKRI